MAELDEETLALRRETVTIIDDREPTDPPQVQFSNFTVIEDSDTGHLVLYLNRYMPSEYREHAGGGAHTYVIEVK